MRPGYVRQIEKIILVNLSRFEENQQTAEVHMEQRQWGEVDLMMIVAGRMLYLEME